MATQDSFTYGKQRIAYTLTFAQRQTLEIAVLPDGKVTVKAPVRANIDDIRKQLLRRARWIVRKINYFKQFKPRTPPRQYIGGETHLFLGKTYRLKINEGEKEEVKKTRGFLWVTVTRKNQERVEQVLEKWLADHTREQFGACVAKYWAEFEKMGFQLPRLAVRHLQQRWGSLSHNQTLTLNSHLIRAPLECFEYVVVHEFCHLSHRDHSKAYFSLLEKIMPDWKRRKQKLEMTLM